MVGVLDEPYSQLTPLSGVVRVAHQVYIGWNYVQFVHPISLAGRYGYSAERAWLNKVHLKLPLQDIKTSLSINLEYNK